MKKILLSLVFSASAFAYEPITSDMVRTGSIFGDMAADIAFFIDELSDMGRPVAFLNGTTISLSDKFGIRIGNGNAYFHEGDGNFDQKKFRFTSPYYSTDGGWSAGEFFALVYNVNNTKQLYQRYLFASASYSRVFNGMVSILAKGDQRIILVQTGIGNVRGFNLGYVSFSKRSIF